MRKGAGTTYPIVGIARLQSRVMPGVRGRRCIGVVVMILAVGRGGRLRRRRQRHLLLLLVVVEHVLLIARRRRRHDVIGGGAAVGQCDGAVMGVVVESGEGR